MTMQWESKRWVAVGMAAGLVGVWGSMCLGAAEQKDSTTTATRIPGQVAGSGTTTSHPSIVATTTRPGISQTATMRFNFENATVDRVLQEVSERFGFIVIKTQNLPNLVTIRMTNPVHADEAVHLVNDFLIPLGYAALETRAGEGADAKTCLRIVQLAEVKRPQIPVFQGRDPDKVPLSNDIITQVIPLKDVDPTRMRNDLVPYLSADAEVSANSSNLLVITDTAARIHRLLEIIATMDKPPVSRPETAPMLPGRGSPMGRR
jgi:type II secretory pathway component GspD/PulD (secretin)